MPGHRAETPQSTTALYVRLPTDAAGKLDRAAEALRSAKKDLVNDLVARYVDPDTDAGLRQLRQLRASAFDEPGPMVVASDEPTWTTGEHSFLPAELPEVLTPAQAALLLQVDERTVVELAEGRKIPGRSLGGAWRFSRAALIAWLARPANVEED